MREVDMKTGPSVLEGPEAHAIISSQVKGILANIAMLEAHRSSILRELRSEHERLSDCRAAARIFGLQIDFPPESAKPKAKVADVVLELASSSGPAGVRVRDLRLPVELAVGRSIHEKTIGMTLYRLMGLGLVTRQGHVWYPAKAA